MTAYFNIRFQIRRVLFKGKSLFYLMPGVCQIQKVADYRPFDTADTIESR